MRVCLVYNPRARLARRVRRAEVVAELRALGAEVEEAPVGEGTAAAVREAVGRGCERVVVAGGDGTVASVLAGVAGTGAGLGLIPLGTGNVLASEAGLRAGRWRAACRVALGPLLASMDLGRANGRWFAVMFGAGLDAQVVADLKALHKERLGRWAYVRQLLPSLAKSQTARFLVRVDEDEIEATAWLVVVSNTARYTWRLSFTEAADPRDGLLDLCVVQAAPLGRLLLAAAGSFLSGWPLAARGLLSRRAAKLTIRSQPPVLWQTDGELGGTTPVTLEVVPHALTIAVAHAGCSLLRGEGR
jgi:diacylglycerol kinase (ATP)